MGPANRRSRRGARFSLAPLGLLGFVGTAAVPALADTGDVVIAEALFRDGKELLAQKDFARACPKLSESFRRDPATGTLLALAMCHEREGKLASAWGEYADVASRSKLEARSDREKAARAKATELESRVSKLTISLADDVENPVELEVTRNGAVVARALLGTALPVDGGTQVIEASAPGKKKWRTKIALASSGEKQTITVPDLDDAGEKPVAESRARPAAPSAPAPVAEPPKEPVPTSGADESTVSQMLATPPAADSRATDSRRGLAPFQRVGLATGAVGIIGLGAGAFFAYRATEKNNDSKAGCSGDLCLPTAKQERLDARAAGNLATIGLIGGGALTAAGVVMYILGRRTSAPPAAASSFEAIPVAGAGTVGGVLRGTF